MDVTQQRTLLENADEDTKKTQSDMIAPQSIDNCDTGSESSDITDVSSLGSRAQSPTCSSHLKTNIEEDSLDLDLLLQAINELEREKRSQKATPKGNSVLRANSKKNYSFSNLEVMNIDRENQRLMKKLHSSKSKNCEARRNMMSSPWTPSALNRFRRQQKIDRENKQLLKRLENAKASRHLQRSALMLDYCNQRIAGVSVAAQHRKRGCRDRNVIHSKEWSNDMASIASAQKAESTTRSRPASAVAKVATKATGCRQRPQSANPTMRSRSALKRRNSMETSSVVTFKSETASSIR